MNEATILSAINDLRRIRAFESASEVEFLLHEMKRRPIVYCFTNEAAEAVLKSHDKDKRIVRLREALAHVQKHLLMNDYGHYEMAPNFDIDVLHEALGEGL